MQARVIVAGIATFGTIVGSLLAIRSCYDANDRATPRQSDSDAGHTEVAETSISVHNPASSSDLRPAEAVDYLKVRDILKRQSCNASDIDSLISMLHLASYERAWRIREEASVGVTPEGAVDLYRFVHRSISLLSDARYARILEGPVGPIDLHFLEQLLTDQLVREYTNLITGMCGRMHLLDLRSREVLYDEGNLYVLFKISIFYFLLLSCNQSASNDLASRWPTQIQRSFGDYYIPAEMIEALKGSSR